MNETLLSSRLAAESRRALAPLQLPVLTVELPSRRVATLLWSMAIGIIAAGAIRQIFLSIYGTHTSAGRLPVFQLGSEFALGDWWGAFQYALAAVLLALCAKSEPDPRWKRYWVALAALFVYLSIDEGAVCTSSARPCLLPSISVGSNITPGSSYTAPSAPSSA
ncbi:MAG TPA: hypothetical protein VFO09_03315 [Methyloceanibacter sp.]|nr:hypothetical protein [Methyloceanibacter sp.]